MSRSYTIYTLSFNTSHAISFNHRGDVTDAVDKACQALQATLPDFSDIPEYTCDADMAITVDRDASQETVPFFTITYDVEFGSSQPLGAEHLTAIVAALQKVLLEKVGKVVQYVSPITLYSRIRRPA